MIINKYLLRGFIARFSKKWYTTKIITEALEAQTFFVWVF